MSETKIEVSQPSPKRQPNDKNLKSGQMKKLSLESSKLLTALRDRANKKSFGRKVKESEILDVAIKLVTSEHLKELQDATYSAQDRLKMRHEDYQRTNGKISFDAYIAKWMSGELNADASRSMTRAKES